MRLNVVLVGIAVITGLRVIVGGRERGVRRVRRYEGTRGLLGEMKGIDPIVSARIII